MSILYAHSSNVSIESVALVKKIKLYDYEFLSCPKFVHHKLEKSCPIPTTQGSYFIEYHSD